MTMPETTQSDLVKRLTEMADLYRRAISDDNEDAQTFADAATEITRLRGHCEAMEETLRLAEIRVTAARCFLVIDDKGDAERHLSGAVELLTAYRKENPDVL